MRSYLYRKSLKSFKRRILKNFKDKTNSEYIEIKEKARALVHQRLEYYNQFYNFKYNRVAIRNQKSRWGSCSRAGNLNFNYRLAVIDPVLADYVIVHELCHLKELNHSSGFWDLVAETMPNYKYLRTILLKIRP